MSLPNVPVALIIAFRRKEGSKIFNHCGIIYRQGGLGAEPVRFGGMPYGPCMPGEEEPVWFGGMPYGPCMPGEEEPVRFGGMPYGPCMPGEEEPVWFGGVPYGPWGAGGTMDCLLSTYHTLCMWVQASNICPKH